MINNIDALLERSRSELRKFTDIAVLGMSGGADSTLVAILCMIALGKENVYAFGMPYSSRDHISFNDKSRKTAQKLGISYKDINIQYQVDHIASGILVGTGLPPGSIQLSNIQMGNIKARTRMVTLYGLCGVLGEGHPDKRVRVVGTGNFSEDFIGYDTKGGDALADIFPIGSLFKSEVYQLLDHFVEMKIVSEEDIDRVPTAGLWEGQTDEGELGHTYSEMEEATISLIRCYDAIDESDQNPTIEFVRKRHLANKHKHQAPPVVNLRKYCTGDIEHYFEDGE